MRKIVQKVVHLKEHRVAVLAYRMSEGSEVQYLTAMPKEGRRMLKEFRETGKFTRLKPWVSRDALEVLEPVSMTMAYTDGWYAKIPAVIDYKEDETNGYVHWI